MCADPDVWNQAKEIDQYQWMDGYMLSYLL